jgi:addiction module HigA family antidote
MQNLEPVTPGEILKEEFLDPMGITISQLCRDTGLDESQVKGVISGELRITEGIGKTLCEYFGLSDGYWLRVQMSCDKR